VGALMDECPNFHAAQGARLGEIVRQPRRVRRLAQRHPRPGRFRHEMLPLDASVVQAYWRLLQTDDECVAYWPGTEVPPQSRWEISAPKCQPGCCRQSWPATPADW
jgi:hypothetical protein